eukprot:gene4848-5095_t
MACADGPCRKLVRERVLRDMLGAVVDPVGSGWKVLIMDSFTTHIMSSTLRMSDLLDAGVSVVEDIDKAREPLPLAAVYFITPSPASVSRLLADFATKPLYPSVHIFFSNRVLVPLLKSLKEVNLEFVVVDGRTFVTQHPKAMIRCMGERSESSRQECEAEVDSIASRLATFLAALHEYPAIRYKQGKVPEPGDAPGAMARSLLTQHLAQKVYERALVLQRSGGLPARESCDLLILDRTVDPVAPVIHEWTYEAMVYDLLPVEDNVIRYTAETAAGRQEAKEHVLDEVTDELWAEMRHAHIADVYTRVSRRFDEFQDRNKAVRHQKEGQAGAALSTRNIKALIQALPQYREVLGLLSVHINVSSDITAVLNQRQLTEMGELEQSLVYGDSTSQDLIRFLQERGDKLKSADKMRLFMAYLATHPEKLDSTKKMQWQKLARLDNQDMATVCNLAFLNVAVMKPPGTQQSKGLSFGLRLKKKKATYRKREGRPDEPQYTVSRFDPVLLDVIEDLLANRLPQDEYPFVRLPEDGDDFGAQEGLRIASARTNRSAPSWARKGSATDAASAPSGILGALQGLGLGSMSQGRRLIVFVAGGVTRSEMRAVHELSRKTGRDIILGSTTVLKPDGFISQLRSMGTLSEQ